MNALDLWQFTPLHEAASKSRSVATRDVLGEALSLLEIRLNLALESFPECIIVSSCYCQISMFVSRHSVVPRVYNILPYYILLVVRLSLFVLLSINIVSV